VRVCDNRSSPTESQREIPRVHLPYLAPPRRTELRRAEPTRTNTSVRAACCNADFTLSRASRWTPIVVCARVPDTRSRWIYERDRLSIV